MKKATGMAFIIVLIISIMQIGVSAVAPSFSLSGPGTIRAGDNIKISVNLNGSGIQAARGQITFDASKLTYKSVTDNLSGWDIGIEQSSGVITFLAIDDKLSAPINSNKILFAINFVVKSTLTAGETISVSAKNLEVSAGDEFYPSNTSFTKTVAQSLSTNNSLSALTVGNADITPGFSPGTTTYSATVPFSVSSLDIAATKQDTKATVQISQNSLDVGPNKVYINVTAENGAKKTYTINVTRQQDPDYVESADGKLKSIIPDKGILSPEFNPDTKLYYVYLPFEIEIFNATGEVRDAKALGVQSQEISLGIGENEFEIIGTAEDGTEEIYTIIAVRMPKVGEDIPEPTATLTPSPEVSSEESSSEESSMPEDISDDIDEGPNGGIPLWGVILIAIATAGTGFLLGKTRFRG